MVTPQLTAADQVLAAWCEVFGRPTLPASADFFELGGHSLLATRLLELIEDRIGVRLPLTALFDEPTLAGFSALVQAAEPERTPS